MNKTLQRTNFNKLGKLTQRYVELLPDEESTLKFFRAMSR